MRLPSLKTYLLILLALITVECVSFLGYLHPIVSTLAFAAIVLITAFTAWMNFGTGLLILFAELCVGGKGYLFSYTLGTNRLSIRIALFIVIAVIWLIRHRGHGNPLYRIQKNIRGWLIALGAIIAWGGVSGLLHGRGAGPVYFDANAFLFFLLAPMVLSPVLDWQKIGSQLIAVLAAAGTVLGVKSLFSLGIFAHLDSGQLINYYRWIRTTGVGEIAYINGNAYRVFFQSQIWGLFSAFILAALLIPKSGTLGRSKWLFLPITFGLTAVIISLSRSFWLGGIGAGLLLLIVAWLRLRWNPRQGLAVIASGLVIIAVSYTLMSWALNFPYPFPPSRNSETARLLGQRFNAIGGEAAASSRLNQLAPLRDGIMRNPVLGSGFGTPLTYQSNDPRQLQSPSRGIFTTYAFEWGYLDFSLKVGLLGLVIYLGLLWVILTSLWRAQTAIALGFIGAVTSLMIVHMTTPYLNHPLGIGLLLLALSFGHMKATSTT